MAENNAGPQKQPSFRIKGVTVSVEVSDKEYGNGNSSYTSINAYVDDANFGQIDDVIDAGLDMFVAAWETVLAGKVATKLLGMSAQELRDNVALPDFWGTSTTRFPAFPIHNYTRGFGGICAWGIGSTRAALSSSDKSFVITARVRHFLLDTNRRFCRNYPSLPGLTLDWQKTGPASYDPARGNLRKRQPHVASQTGQDEFWRRSRSSLYQNPRIPSP